MARCVSVMLVAAAGAAHADNSKLATAPCVNREPTMWRQVRDAKLSTDKLDYCTGEDCWSLDLKAMTAVNVPRRSPAAKVAPDPEGTHTDGHGTVLATADLTHVELCPKSKPCKSFPLKLAPGDVYPLTNDAVTLGAVVHTAGQAGDQDRPTTVFAFDVVAGKQLGTLRASYIEALDHGFLVDMQTLYSAAFKKVGPLATNDQVWVKLGTTDRIALRDDVKGAFVLQDTTTAKVLGRIPTGIADAKTFFTLLATLDGNTVYAIGWASDEGEIIRIDTKAAKITARVTPTVCAAGTHRVN